METQLGYTAEFGGDATGFGFDNAGGAIPDNNVWF